MHADRGSATVVMTFWSVDLCQAYVLDKGLPAETPQKSDICLCRSNSLYLL